jgi:hypothetical protein
VSGTHTDKGGREAAALLSETHSEEDLWSKVWAPCLISLLSPDQFFLGHSPHSMSLVAPTATSQTLTCLLSKALHIIFPGPPNSLFLSHPQTICHS